jgi:hypothetical protein
MLNRPMLFFGVLLAAVVVPYVLLDEKLAQTARSQWGRLAGSGSKEADDPLHTLQKAAASAVTNMYGPNSTAPVPMEQAFRFDLTPQWVASRWPRVSTVLGDMQQLGMRVALVSGTRSDDVAGSLTYYFDQHHQLQRITFTGLTADPRRLLATVVTPNGLKSQPTTSAARYIAGDPARPSSEVTVRFLPVIVANTERSQAEVAIDLRRADVLGWQAKAQQEPEPALLPTSYRRW